MSPQMFLLLCLNFLFIGVLPRIFFRKGGRLNLRWWLTALPLFAAPVTAILMVAGFLQSAVRQPDVRLVLELAAVVLSASSIALIALTIGSNRVPLSLWHQQDDSAQHIVTFGAYRRVRHPFYAAFLLALTAAVLVAPHLLTVLTLIYGFIRLNATAAGEEKHLASSQFGHQYRDYMSRTGRFIPRWKSSND